MKKNILFPLLFVFLVPYLNGNGGFLLAQGDIHQQSNSYEWPTDHEVVKKLKAWQDLKFGVLIHWGLYAVPGIVESWSIADEDWIRRDTTMTYQQYKDWYWGVAEQFNPTSFDPEQWAQALEEAGMKYAIFTAKHHDGFCMFDSHETDFTIANHAFKNNPKRDVLKHVLEAFRKRDFKTGTYFSKPDWHSQYYWWDVYSTKGRSVNYPIEQHPWRWEQFKQFTYKQIEEILTHYGNVDILWLDGGWVRKERNQDIDMPRIAQMARHNQSGIIIVDRTVHGPYENYLTPERTIPETQLDYPWESCIPLSDAWGYVKHPNWKSPEKVVNTLIEIVAKGGNFVLGIGPTPEGLIQADAVDILKSIGVWMKRNGRALYNTVPTPHYQEGNVWFTAAKDGKSIYALLMVNENGTLPESVTWTTHLPLKSICLVSNGRKLKTKIKDNKVTVYLPKGLQQQSLAMEIK